MAALGLVSTLASAQPFDLVIVGARVIDPESGLDAVRHVGIKSDRIAALSDAPLAGKEAIDATGLVLAPGFIDLHWHGKDPRSNYYEAADGVTSSFELEVGVADVERWYEERAGRMPVNFGVAVGHGPVRMVVMSDPGDFLPAGDAARQTGTSEQIEAIKRGVEAGLERGAVGVGLALAYTPSASHWEVLEIFRTAARHGAAVYVHLRGASSLGSADREQGLIEVLGHSAASGAPVHIAHINSSGQQWAPRMLGVISEARSRGIDVTTECYPYTAGMTRIESFLFDAWMDKTDEDYGKLQWAATGERLTRETFLEYRRRGGLVIVHANTEEIVRATVLHPLTMIASDGFDVYPRNGHPRSAGTYSRVLGRYVREQGALPLMDALRKMTLMPAQRLEARVPEMKDRGRVRVGAYADLVVFDPDRIVDRATYEDPAVYSEGMRYVLVNGQFVVRDGTVLDQATPGRAIRAPSR